MRLPPIEQTVAAGQSNLVTIYLAEAETKMPWITVQLLTGRTVEQKRELVAALTCETSRICGCATDAVSIVIEDVDKDNWGIGGILASEKFPGPPSSLGSGDPRYRKD